MNINPISYDSIWVIIRLELIILNFLNEKNLLKIIIKIGIPITNIIIIKFIKNLLFSIFIGIKLIIIMNKTKIIIGEIFHIILLIFLITIIFFENNFNTSENGWKIPKIPTLFGPRRIWKIPKILRSIIVKKATDKNIKINIIIKFNKINSEY
jgi:hypothetical protein